MNNLDLKKALCRSLSDSCDVFRVAKKVAEHVNPAIYDKFLSEAGISYNDDKTKISIKEGSGVSFSRLMLAAYRKVDIVGFYTMLLYHTFSFVSRIAIWIAIGMVIGKYLYHG